MQLNNVEHDKSANTQAIIIKYDDGRRDILSKGVAIRLEDVPGTNEAKVTMDMLKITGEDLRFILVSLIQFADKLGMFNDVKEGENDDVEG